MPVAVEYQLRVQYGFVWLHAADVEPPELIAARGGQRNGILGAATRGVLSMLTGLHTGVVPFRAEIWEQEPALAADWEDVVEIDFDVEDTELMLTTFDAAEAVELPSTGSYRARYCAAGMDLARAQDTRLDGDEVTDRYLLVLWPSAPAPERVVRERSSIAAYWAGVARETPAPTAPSDAERAVAQRAARDAQRHRDDLQRDLEAHLRWHGVQPTPAMRRIGPAIAGLAQLDPVLAELIANATADGRRQIALWAARVACDHATGAAVDWRPALAALANGVPLPAPFNDSAQLFQALYGSGERRTRTNVARVQRVGPGRREHTPIDPPAAAAATLTAAQDPDPATAAIQALVQAAAGRLDPAQFYADAREAFATGRSG